jgi:SM-20-related protein
MGRDATRVAIADGLEGPGFAVVPGFLAGAQVAALARTARAHRAAGGFRPAAVGSGARRQVCPGVRGDQIFWLSQPTEEPETRLLQCFETLRLALNRELALGLFEFECHFALYPPGAAYARHLDRLVNDERRVVSCVVYLNHDWSACDGGQLRLYAGAQTVDVLPEGGTLVAFLSERFWHEVLPAGRERLSLTGWFRRRA